MAISQPYATKEIDPISVNTTRPSYHNVNHPSIVSKWLNESKGTALRNPTDAVSRRQNKFFQLSSSLFGDNSERQKVREIGEQNFKRQVNEGLKARKVTHLRNQQEEDRLYEAMSVPGLSNLGYDRKNSVNLDPFVSGRRQSTVTTDVPSYSGLTNYSSQPAINYGSNLDALPTYDTQAYKSSLTSYQPSYYNDVKRSNSFDYSPTTWSDANSAYRTVDPYAPHQYNSQPVFDGDVQRQLRDQQAQHIQQLQKENFEAKKLADEQQRMRDRRDDQILEDNFQRQQQRVRQDFEDEKNRRQTQENMFRKKRDTHQSRMQNLSRDLQSAKLVNGKGSKLPDISLSDTLSLKKLHRLTEGLRDERPLNQKRDNGFQQPNNLERNTGLNHNKSPAAALGKRGGRRSSIPPNRKQQHANPSLNDNQFVSDRPPNPFFDKRH